jgi:hypothetical protein
MHDFLTLKSLDGKLLANGEVLQSAEGDKVTAHLVFKFNDGSLYEDTAVYAQQGQFRLLSDRRIERGPSFPRAIDTQIDASSGLVTVRTGIGAREKIVTRRRKLPEDMANGIFMMLVNHFPPGTNQITVPFLATTPELHMVNFVMSRGALETVGEAPFQTQLAAYVIKVKIPGALGMLAGLAGKRLRDIKIWTTTGPNPAFVRFEGSLFVGGPIWRIEIAPVAVPEHNSEADRRNE